jgi:hypothetical protein
MGQPPEEQDGLRLIGRRCPRDQQPYQGRLILPRDGQARGDSQGQFDQVMTVRRAGQLLLEGMDLHQSLSRAVEPMPSRLKYVMYRPWEPLLYNGKFSVLLMV